MKKLISTYWVQWSWSWRKH